MPLPHERAAIDRAQGKKRARLEEAAAVLDRVRASHPGVDNLQQLPAEVRAEALRALREFHPGMAAFGLAEAAMLLMLAVALGLMWFKPVRVFRCEAQGAGLARCVVTERMFGLIPVRQTSVDGIASTSTSQRSSTSESRDDDGVTRTRTTRISELTFAGADGGELWSASESHLLGARLEQIATEVDELKSGEKAGRIVRVQGIWPVLLASSLFLTFTMSPLGSKLGLELRNRGVIPESAYKALFYWGTLFFPLLLSGIAWGLVLLGKNPPAALAALL